MATDMRIVGYLPEYRAGHLAQLPSELLTDLIVFSIAPIPEGDIQAGDRLLAMLPKLPRGGDVGKCVRLAVLQAAPIEGKSEAQPLTRRASEDLTVDVVHGGGVAECCPSLS